MRNSQMKTILLASALTVLAVSAAHADLTVTQSTRVESPQIRAYLESMTPQQRAQMARSGNPLFSGAPIRSTVYLRGTKTRLDVGGTSYIADAATHRTITINRRTRTYTVRPTHAGGGPGTPAATVKDTGQNRTIAGHPAHHYLLTATLPSQPGALLQGDIWAARDIAQPPVLTSGQGPLAAMQSVFRRVKGFPLKTTLALTGSPLGNSTATTSTLSISKSPIPASAFAIPAGYKKSDMNAGM